MRRSWFVGLGLLFVGSGACGVGLELLWTRMLMGVFGGTTLAVVTVLTAYMGGLAWGSWWGGRWVDRLGGGQRAAWQAAWLYGLCEISVGLWALSLPWWIGGLPSLQRAVAEGWGSSGLTAGRFVICVLLLGVPTTLMGATLPLISRAFLRDARWLGAEVGRLYALNTAGAVFGAFVLGFFLLPSWGIWRSLCWLAGIDILIGVFACVAAMWMRTQKPQTSAEIEQQALDSTPIFPSASKQPHTSAAIEQQALTSTTTPPALPHTRAKKTMPSEESNRDISNEWDNEDIEQAAKMQRLREARRMVGWGLACSGCLGMIAQVAWTRAFSMILGSSTYAFSMILVVFLTGLALGGAVGGWLAQRSERAGGILGLVFGIAALGVYWTVLSMDALPLLFFRWTRGLELSTWALLGIKAALCGGMMCVPTLAMGMSFPLALQAWWRLGQQIQTNERTSPKAYPSAESSLTAKEAYPSAESSLTANEAYPSAESSLTANEAYPSAESSLTANEAYPSAKSDETTEKVQPLGSEVGRLYALNTLGAIVGSASVGFVWIPWLGVQGSLGWVAFGYGLWSLLLWSEEAEERGFWRALSLTSGLMVMGVVWFWTPAWSPHRMSLGLFRVAHLKRMTEEALRQPAPVLFYREGLHTTVTVERFGPHIGQKVNGKTDASTASDMPTQILSGALPLLLHPKAREVAVIGWGSGVTVGSVLQFPVKRVIAIELEPAVVEGAKFFAPWNHQPERDPRLQIRLDDGRNFLAVSREHFDVLISEPSNPWMSGVSALFTVEFFQLARARLRRDGILCQWVQLYELSPDNIRALLHSVARVFPHVYLFALSRRSRDTLLIATLQPLQIQRDAIAQHFAHKRSRAELLRGGMNHPIDLLPRLLADDEALRLLTRGAALNTDDNARLEMRAPFELLTHVETDGAKVLLNDLGSRAHRWSRLFPLPVLAKDAPPSLRAAFEAELALAWLRFGDPQRATLSLQIAHRKLQQALSIPITTHQPSLSLPSTHSKPQAAPARSTLPKATSALSTSASAIKTPEHPPKSTPTISTSASTLKAPEHPPKSTLLKSVHQAQQVWSLLTQTSTAAKIEVCVPALQNEQFQPAPPDCPTLFPQLPMTTRDRARVMTLSRRHPQRIMTRGLLLYRKGRKKAALRELAHLIQEPAFLRQNPGGYFLLGQLYQAAQIEPEAVWFTRLFVQSTEANPPQP
ncbi:fused MFS/spermidine synthase [Myxococcota bacterium]|nr:fused MFS/spermidine synthase [Myxococcota bacterium]